MRFRVSYSVSRGNSLENEDHIADEVLFLRHQSIDIGDREHDRDNDRGWFMVPALEQVVWLQRHYARTTRYVHITSTAVVLETADLANDTLGVGALLRRARFVSQVLEFEHHGEFFLRYAGNEQLAYDTAVLLAYTMDIEAYLLPASAGNTWSAANRPYRASLVTAGSAEGAGKLVIPTTELPTDTAGLRGLIASVRSSPRQRITLRYSDEYDLANTVATWLAEGTGANVSVEQD